MKEINWGIIGCGNIANRFAVGLDAVKGTTLKAVASRTPGKAAGFAKNHGGDVCADYETLVKRDDIHVVYIATTHNFHYEHVKLALEHKKAVLCEKPVTVNARELKELIKLARQHKCFMMEAMWTRFLPVFVQLREWLEQDIIGSLTQFRADFGYNYPFNPDSRVYNNDLAGGGLLDAGIYPVSLASMIKNEQPVQIKAIAELGKTNVDEQSIYLFKYSDGCLATISSAVKVPLDNRMEIFGDKGKITIEKNFINTQAIELKLFADQAPVIKQFNYSLETGFKFEIQEVVNLLREDKLESPMMPLDESLAIMETMDSIRNEIGLVYKNDN